MTIGELAMVDRHQQRDRLRIGVHRPNDHRFHASAKSSPRQEVRTRNRHGGWMRGKQRIGARADQFLDVGFGLRRRRLRARLPENFGTKVAYWSAISQPANSIAAQARTLMAIFIAGIGEATLVGS